MLNLFRKHVLPSSRKLTLQAFSVMLSLAVSACSHAPHAEHHAAQQDNAHPHHKVSTVKNADFHIPLNGQDKWLLDSHTRSVLKTMHSRFLQASLTRMTQAERIYLAAQLEQDLDKLIQGCTMESGAHDALHTYLNALVPAVSQLKESGELVHAEQVRHLLEIYPEYFN